MSLRWRRQAPSQRRLSRQGGPPLGVGGVDVLHRGRGGDAEYAYEVDGVGGVPGLVEDAVLAEFGRAEPQRPEDAGHDHAGDRREGVHDGGLLADQQVGVGGAGPAAVPFAEPGAGEGVGELVGVEGVAGQLPPDGQRPGWQVEVFQEEAGRLALAEAMDGDLGELRRAGLAWALAAPALFELGNVASTLLILRATGLLHAGGRSQAGA